MRELKGYSTNMDLDFRKDDNERGLRTFNASKSISFSVSDLLISTLTDKRLNSTEKSILGIIYDDIFSRFDIEELWGGEKIEVGYIASSVKADIDSEEEVSSDITTKYLQIELDLSKRTIFSNLYSLVEKGIISFRRESFSEFGRIRINLGYIVSRYYRKEGE